MHQTKITHRPPKAWLKITVDVPQNHAEIIAAFLADLTEGGLEQSESLKSGDSKYVLITAYLPDDANRNQKTKRLHSYLEDHNKISDVSNQIQWTEELIQEQDWNSAWKKHFKPDHLTERIVVKPSWESYEPTNDEVVLEMDPGMAFGTGQHASTQLALGLIEELYSASSPPNSILDVGTGTGILGLSCCLLGAQNVIAIDNDIDARVAARENIIKNKLNMAMAVPEDNLSQIDTFFELVIANITSDVLIKMSKSLYQRMLPGAYLILAGILTGTQGDQIIETYSSLGLLIDKQQTKDEWIAFRFHKPQMNS